MLAVIVSCRSRLKVLADLLADLSCSDWDWPVIVTIDDEGIGFKSETDTSVRCAENIHLAVKRGYDSGVKWFILFEDDSEVNIHLKHNILNWEPMVNYDDICYGGLSTNGGNKDVIREGQNWYEPDSNKSYGIQGTILTREFARFVLDDWNMFPPLMPDLKFARMAGMNRVGRFYKHWPSLVRHRHEVDSVFGHGIVKTENFDKIWKA